MKQSIFYMDLASFLAIHCKLLELVEMAAKAESPAENCPSANFNGAQVLDTWIFSM